MNWETAAVAGLLALVAISYVVEALRSQPTAPERLDWAPDIPIRYVTLNGTKLRYIVTGQGPALVLLHTLRTQLRVGKPNLRPEQRPHPRGDRHASAPIPDRQAGFRGRRVPKGGFALDPGAGALPGR